MTREEDRELLSNLIFANKKFAENLDELKKLDALAARAAALNEIDTHKILEKLNDVSFTQISRKIVDTIREDLKQQRSEILTAADGAAAAAKDLAAKTVLLKESSDSMLQIDNMAENLEEVAKDIKNWRNKSMFIAIGLSLFFGIASGTIASNISVLMSPESIQNAQILKSKFGKIAALRDEQNPKLYYLVIPEHHKIKEVVSFVDNDMRYIKIEAK
jgi:hypothetical protein